MYLLCSQYTSSDVILLKINIMKSSVSVKSSLKHLKAPIWNLFIKRTTTLYNQVLKFLKSHGCPHGTWKIGKSKEKVPGSVICTAWKLTFSSFRNTVLQNLFHLAFFEKINFDRLLLNRFRLQNPIEMKIFR